ncbi:MAG: helix-turn-helix domain-containing protein [Clostridiaceae bacterium]|nr:helix-turn-helix domain-containing protein [Clostridiaceae bacterium]
MNSILSDSFKTDFTNSVKNLYLEALEQARRDMSITKEYLTVQETMKYMEISRNTLNKWLLEGLNIYRIDNKQYIKKSDLHNFIDQHQV